MPTSPTTPKRRRRVLAIDDEPSIRTTLSNILKDEGHETVA